MVAVLLVIWLRLRGALEREIMGLRRAVEMEAGSESVRALCLECGLCFLVGTLLPCGPCQSVYTDVAVGSNISCVYGGLLFPPRLLWFGLNRGAEGG